MKLGVSQHPERDRLHGPVDRPAAPGYRLLDLLDARRGTWSAEGPGGYKAALRFIPLPSGVDPDDFQELARDRASRHPNVQATFASWKNETTLALASELPYGSLWDRYLEAVKAGASGIPRDELIEYLGRAARGLDYLNGQGPTYPERPWTVDRHGQDISHGDVSPRTLVFIGGAIKVTDMDPVRWAVDLTRDGDGDTAQGDADPRSLPRYAAPERFAGRSCRNSDQFSLAVTYYRLRVGRVPFPRRGPVFVAGRLQRLIDLTVLPEAERAAISRALALDPGHRWPSCSAFFEALRNDVLAAEGCGSGLHVSHADFPPPPPQEETESAAAVPHARPVRGRAFALPLAVAASAAAVAAIVCFEGPGDNRARAGRPTTPLSTVTVAKPSTLLARLSSPTPEVPLEGDEVEPADDDPGAAATLAPPSPPRGPLKTAIEPVTSAARPEPMEIDVSPNGPPPIEQAIVEEPETPTRSFTAIESAASGLVTGVAASLPVSPRIADPIKRTGLAAVVRDGLGVDALQPVTTLDRATPPEPTVPPSVPRGHDAPGPASVASREAVGPVEARPGAAPRAVTAANPTPDEDQAGKKRDKSEAPELVASAGPSRTGETVRPTALLGSVVASRRLGDVLLRRRDFDKAITAYSEAIGHDPGDHLALHGRGLAAFNKGDYLKALTDLSASLVQKPEVPTALNNRGLARLALGDAAKAIADFDAAARLDPADPVVRYNRGRAHAQAGANDRALADYDEAIHLDPKFARAYKARGDTLAKTGDGDSDRNRGRALEDYNTALRLSPDDANTLNNRGLLLFAKGEHYRAIADFDEAIRINPNYAVVRYNRGRVYAHMGDNETALASFAEALKLDPNLTRASQARSEVEKEIMKRSAGLAGRRLRTGATTPRDDRTRPAATIPANSTLRRATASTPTKKR